MKSVIKRRCAVLVWMAGVAFGQEWKAGVAKVDITPQKPIWMAGYAARTRPSEGVIAPLYVKALAVEDGRKSKDGRVVIVTADVIGFPRVVADQVAVAVLKRYGVERAQLVLNASHTHSGPVVWPNLSTMYPMDDAQRNDVQVFTRGFVDRVVDVVGMALADLKPMTVESAQGKASFAVYRRMTVDGAIKLAPNAAGPVDHSVPTVQVRDAAGQLKAVMFGYSCHNTTMTGEFYQLNGDYAGFAQAEVERMHPGAVALFATACAGDQNPNPRSSLELARRHGKELGMAVGAAIAGKREKLNGKIQSRFQLIDLPMQYFTRDQFEKDLKNENPVAVARAKNMLAAFDRRDVNRRVAYPIQAIRLGQLPIVTLGGEVVVEYCLRLKKELGDERMFVMGYSNDVMCYIPTKQQIAEGGYEAKDSFLYYGLPAPLAGEIEEQIVTSVKRLLAKIR